MMVGRPKKPGKRYPCGKRTIGQRQEDIIGVAVAGRLNEHGLKADKVYRTHKDDEGMTGRQIAETNILGSPLNKLLHWRVITQEQANAGNSFAAVMRDYLSSAKLQKSSPSKANFVPGQPDNGEGPPVKGEATAKRYMEALAEVDRSSPLSRPTVTSIVWRACYEEKDVHGDIERGALRVGLNEIHRINYGRGRKAA
jgi:hypothetical protein